MKCLTELYLSVNKILKYLFLKNFIYLFQIFVREICYLWHGECDLIGLEYYWPNYLLIKPWAMPVRP